MAYIPIDESQRNPEQIQGIEAFQKYCDYVLNELDGIIREGVSDAEKERAHTLFNSLYTRGEDALDKAKELAVVKFKEILDRPTSATAENCEAISELDQPIWALLFDTGLTVPDLTYPGAIALQTEMHRDPANGKVFIITNAAAGRSKPRSRPQPEAANA